MLLRMGIKTVRSIGSFKNIFIGLTTSQNRNLMGFVRNALGLDPPRSPDEPSSQNRFYPWDQSPSQDIRERAARIKAFARCPVTNKNIDFTCKYSGIPTHHSEEAWKKDVEYHRSKRHEILRKVNIYEHDLRSGRPFPEFDFPQEQAADHLINLTNWDLYFYTRSFYSMDTEFQLAAVTKMLSYPLTVGSVLHQYTPYSLNPKGPITLEGLKSLAALQYTLYPEQHKRTFTLQERPLRIFILGARAEAQLPGHVWKQLQYLFPESVLEVHFIGPECNYNRERKEYITSATPLIKTIDRTMKLIYHTDYFHVYHKAQDFFPYNPYNDVFFCFHPGFAAPETTELWMNSTVSALLQTKCAIFTTGFNKKDMNDDFQIIQEKYGSELDILMDPIENVYGSTKWELNDMNPHEVYRFNMYIAGFRGKRYNAIEL